MKALKIVVVCLWIITCGLGYSVYKLHERNQVVTAYLSEVVGYADNDKAKPITRAMLLTIMGNERMLRNN